MMVSDTVHLSDDEYHSSDVMNDINNGTNSYYITLFYYYTFLITLG